MLLDNHCNFCHCYLGEDYSKQYRAWRNQIFRKLKWMTLELCVVCYQLPVTTKRRRLHKIVELQEANEEIEKVISREHKPLNGGDKMPIGKSKRELKEVRSVSEIPDRATGIHPQSEDVRDMIAEIQRSRGQILEFTFSSKELASQRAGSLKSLAKRGRIQVSQIVTRGNKTYVAVKG